MPESIYRVSYKVQIPVDHLGLPPVGEPHKLWLTCIVGSRNVLHRAPVTQRTAKYHKWRGHFDALYPIEDVKRFGNILVVRCSIECQDWSRSGKAKLMIEEAVCHIRLAQTIKIWQPRYDDELGWDYSTHKNIGTKTLQSLFKFRPSIIPGPESVTSRDTYSYDEVEDTHFGNHQEGTEQSFKGGQSYIPIEDDDEVKPFAREEEGEENPFQGDENGNEDDSEDEIFTDALEVTQIVAIT